MIPKNLVERLIHVEKREDCALSGELACSCGGERFDLLHNGRETRGCLSSPIVPVRGKLRVEAVCGTCGARYLLLDPAASDPQTRTAGEILKPTALDAKRFGERPWKIRVLLNYLTENFGTERCEDVYFEVFHTGSGKWKRIVEA